jgi:hypothetical protein
LTLGAIFLWPEAFFDEGFFDGALPRALLASMVFFAFVIWLVPVLRGVRAHHSFVIWLVPVLRGVRAHHSSLRWGTEASQFERVSNGLTDLSGESFLDSSGLGKRRCSSSASLMGTAI